MELNSQKTERDFKLITQKSYRENYTLTGEYAIVEPGNSAVLVAVNQFITASIEPSELTFGNIIL